MIIFALSCQKIGNKSISPTMDENSTNSKITGKKLSVKL
jgi:hypothetical protein